MGSIVERNTAVRLGLVTLLVVAAAGARTKKSQTAAPPVNPPQYRSFAEPIAESSRALHLVDRLTFGATEADLAAVEDKGINEWLDHQLHPDRIPENPVLERKLEAYDSLRMSIHDTWVHYPQPRLIAAVARGVQPPPDDPELRVVVNHLIERYLRRKQADGNGAAEAQAATSAPEKQSGDDSDLDPKIPLTQFLSPRQIEQLRYGKPEEKRAILAAVPEDRAIDFAYSLRQKERVQLIPFAQPALQRKLILATSPQRVVLEDLSSAKILRAVYSTRQLNEELADFWFNHFNVYFDKGSDRFMLPAYEREAIRPHVLGKFRDLLLATAQSPAMLFYLDNAESVAPNAANALNPGRVKRGLNENYGRELMELHTLGVDGGYTQQDVVEVARCFTGWTITPPRRGSVFEFNEKMHDKGQKVVLGHVIPAGGGMDDGLRVIDILARSPITAHHLSLQLAQRFVADDPPPSLVDRMAAAYLKSDGDLRELVRTMVLSPEFFSQGAFRAKVKTPFEMIVSAVRASHAGVDSALALGQLIGQLGEPLYRKIEPTGYSNANAEWVSSAALLTRMNFALALANNKVPGVRVDEDAWSRLGQNDPMKLAQTLLGANPDQQTAAAIQRGLTSEDFRSQLAESARLQAPSIPSLVAGLAIGSPQFQRR